MAFKTNTPTLTIGNEPQTRTQLNSKNATPEAKAVRSTQRWLELTTSDTGEDTGPLSDWAGDQFSLNDVIVVKEQDRLKKQKNLEPSGSFPTAQEGKSLQHLSACWLFPRAVLTWPLLIRITKDWADSDSGGLRWLWSKSSKMEMQTWFLMYSNPQNLCLWWTAVERTRGGVGSGVAARELAHISWVHGRARAQAAGVCTSLLPVVP